MSDIHPKKRVAIMQPYFFPYAGYFRLFEQVDQFVIYDCVQFPRRSRVHRTEVPGPGGGPEWLTLPLARCPRDTPISRLRFAPGARGSFDKRLSRLPWIYSAAGPAAARVRTYLQRPLDSVVDYLEDGLRLVRDLLDLAVPVVRSSSLHIDPTLHGQERIIAIASALGATCYVNAPDGRHLYDAQNFAKAGIELQFLTPYSGRHFHLLPAIMMLDPQLIRQDIQATATLWNAEQ